jgi:CheY-like chemotaxis protein
MANIESAQALKLAGLRVLIVEDEALVAFQLEDMLADLGCTINRPASRVGHALDLLGRQTVDAAVLNLNVGGELVYPVADALARRGLPLHFRYRIRRRWPDHAVSAAGSSCRSPSFRTISARPCWRA